MLAMAVLTAGIAVQACVSTTSDLGVTSPGAGFAFTLHDTEVSLTSGGSASTFIKATRTGSLTGAITYLVTGAPAGLAASVTSTSVADSSTLTVTASATLAAATYPIVVNAIAIGALPQQAQVLVTVRSTAGGAPVIESAVVGGHSCALTTAGAAYCWGYNANGQLGNNETSIINTTPVAVAGEIAFQSLAVSKVEDATCGLSTAGAAYCWGRNTNGQLGDGTTTRRLTPVPVAGGLTFRSLALGSEHACGVATNGTAYCWGYSPNGAFGDGSVGERLTPTVAAPGLTFQSIVAGTDYTCGLTPAGAAFCWGVGVLGQLGNGAAVISATPVAVSGGLTFRSLAAGGQAACGLTTDGKVYCWGYNFYGTLGDGSGGLNGVGRRLTPVAVAGGLTFQSIGAGYQTMCGVTDTGAGYCWGANEGAVGDGTTDARTSPVLVAGGLTFRSISSGTGHSCGVTTANAVYCWGENADGELGDGTIDVRLTPVPVRWP